ncbi:anti-sigma factor [Mangrovibrevibacter kandeliae]|uniref:anti-sigma factor n=1 Tax=Mangrovibrevibacter kandeliae TaxID=2968473 RepID=UPI0021194E26|nr:anti-sigma factor [Aurantimonas sp. CSK15Z-1]MCQ8783573.1 anti-sigma factor [Aurantimonas sp. CSK15Z-1]
MSESPNEPGEDLAAEYALGLLGAADRRSVERRRDRDPAFDADVAAWEERLAPMLTVVEPVAPPAAVWEAIEGDLDRMQRRAAERSAQHGQARPSAGAAPRRDAGRLWRWLAIGSMTITAACLALVVYNLVATENLPRLAAVRLGPDGGAPLFTAVIDPGSNSATLVPAGVSPDAQGRVTELWLLPQGDKPISLGVVATDKAQQVQLPDDFASLSGSAMALAISLEPKGGSPTGQPTGPVVASGPLQPI